MTLLASSPSSRPTGTGSPATVAKCITNGAKAKIMPAERSISPPIISMISPNEMIAAGAMNCDRFCRLAELSRKSRFSASK